MTLRIGSLCSGYEGLGMAVQAVMGGELAWVADNDPGASAVLAHRYPSAPNLGDIAATDWTAVEPVDVLTAGFPCQDISCAGRRAGLREGNRSGVWFHVARAIAVLRPPMVVIENVKELLSERADSGMERCPWCMGDVGDEPDMRALGAVLADLAALGFDAEWVSVPAGATGACHLRWRVFILAWPSADTAGFRPGEPADETVTVAGSRRARPVLGRRGVRALADPRGEGLEIRGLEHHGPERQAAERGGAELAPADAGSRGRRNGPGQQRRQRTAERDPRHSPRPAWADAAFWSHPGAFGRYEAAVRRHERTFGRSAPAPVEPGGDGKPRLNPRFSEWMMTLPEGWVTDVPGLTRPQMFRAIGNGVIPAQAATALRVLLERSGLLPLVAADLTQAEGGEAA